MIPTVKTMPTKGYSRANLVHVRGKLGMRGRKQRLHGIRQYAVKHGEDVG
jgi:ABC-type sugar transport system substrate-binding protein